MCRVNQFVFSCGCPATERFRYKLCRSPNSESCVIEDDDYKLNFRCRRCIVHEILTESIQPKHDRTEDNTRQWSSAPTLGKADNRYCWLIDARFSEGERNFWEEDPGLDFEWIVPSRCFVDPGFRSLDPFEDDRRKQLVEGASSINVPREEERDLAPDELEDNSTAEQHHHSTEEQSPPISTKLNCNGRSTEEQQNRSTEGDRPPISIKLNCNWHAKPGPCCVQQRRRGAIWAERPEDVEARVTGKIVGDTCVAPF
jgi:hypothetical protein